MPSWGGRSVLVAGGAGFLGSALTRALVHAGARVHVADGLMAGTGGNLANIADIADRVQFHHLDLSDSERLRPVVARCDVVFNLVGRNAHQESMLRPGEDLRDNVGAQLGLLDACRRAQRPPQVVLASTRQLYGRPERLPVDETHPVRPVDVNGVHRHTAEEHHRLYAEVYGAPVTTVRLTNCYGPGMLLSSLAHGFIAVWIGQLLAGDPITVWGGGQRRDLLHVDDAVAGLLHAATIGGSDVGEVYNLGSHDVLTLGELAALLSGLHEGGRHMVTEFPSDHEAIDVGSYYTDFSKLAATGWQPRVPLHEGLQDTLTHYRRLRAATS